MWYYATFKDYEEAKASAKEDKEQGYKVEIERLDGLGGTTYKVWTWIDESLKEDKTSAQKYNNFLHRTFEMAKKANLAMKYFLIKNGVSEEEAEKLYQDTGLHGSPLQQKLIDMGLKDEFFSKYDYSKGVMKESLTEENDTLIYEVDSNFVNRCEEINKAEHNETMSEQIGTYDDGCYVYFDAFDEKDGGYCQYVLYDKEGHELGFTDPLNEDEVIDEFELDDNHKLIVKVKEVEESLTEAEEDKEKINYNVDDNGVLHIYLGDKILSDVSDCGGMDDHHLLELVADTLYGLGYYWKEDGTISKIEESLKESKEDEVMDILKRENAYNESDEFICYNIPEGIITSFNFDDAKDEFESKEELLNSKDGFNLGICENTKENLKKLIAKYKDDILSAFEESLKESEGALTGGVGEYSVVKSNDWYDPEGLDIPSKAETIFTGDAKSCYDFLYKTRDELEKKYADRDDISVSRIKERRELDHLEKDGPFGYKQIWKEGSKTQYFEVYFMSAIAKDYYTVVKNVDNKASESYNDKELKESLDKELEDKLAQIYNEGDIYFDYADNDGEMFIILDGWDDVHKLQKALKPEFEPNDEYDTSVLDELFNDEWGFSDEYSKCDHCGKLIRTAPNSYSWVPDFFVDNENGEIICGDCVREDPRAYLETLYNNPEVANTILSTSDLEAQGFERIGETYENGWYDRNDSPEEILNKALEEHPNGVFVFSITTQGQFATQFELWGAQLDMDERLKESNGGDVFNEMVNFIENELNHLVIKDKDSKNRILTCYWDNTLSDFYLKEMNGKIIFVEDLEDEDGNPIDWGRLMSDEGYLKDNFASVSTFEEFKEGIKEEDSTNEESDEEEYKEDDLIDLGEDEVPMTFGEVLEMFLHRLSREGSLIENMDEVARKCALDYIKEHDGKKIEREARR